MSRRPSRLPATPGPSDGRAIIQWLPRLARYVELCLGTDETVRRFRLLADDLERNRFVPPPTGG